MRFLTRRRVAFFLAFAAIAIAAAIGGVIAYLNSEAFEARARTYIVDEIARLTGASVTLGEFEWRMWQRRFRLGDLVLRGLEPAGEAPLAHFSRIDIGIHFRALLDRHIDLFELTFTQPQFHIIVTPDGKTNFPSPAQQANKPNEFQISIDNFNVVNGAAILNEQRINLDLSLTNLAAILNYRRDREFIAAHLRYDGVLDRSPGVKLAIPYTLSADVDYTRATILAHRLVLSSGRNEVKLQGKISQVLGSDISGKLDYTGKFQAPFLNYFFVDEALKGQGEGTGSLEFSKGTFFTQGTLTSDAIDYEGWHTTKISGQYTYRYPDLRLTFRDFKGFVVGGTVAGEVTVDHLPGPSRVNLNLTYGNIDTNALTRAYPWDRKYRVFSRATGTLAGWFEGKLARYDLSGRIDLKSYPPPAAGPEIVALPLDGSTGFALTPRDTQITGADMRLHSTAVKADGLITSTMPDLKVQVESTDLKDLAFLYADANGNGTFNGSITGTFEKPLLDGEFTLANYAYKQWVIQNASGAARLDTAAESAVLRNVRVRQGESEILVNGSSALSGSPIDLRIQSNKVTAQDVKPFIARDLGGTFSGDVRLTGLPPALKVEGDIRADNLSVDSHLIGNTRGHVRLVDPIIEVDQLTVRQGDSTLTGNVSLNRTTEAVRFSARVNSVNLQMFVPLGLPDSIQGVIRQADLQGQGTIRQPNVKGSVTLQNLSLYGEAFPQTQIDLASTGTKLDVNLDAGQRLSVKGQIDTAVTGYPFTARATFNQYALEHLAGVSSGSITATGMADIAGRLTDRSQLRGDGRIESATIRVQDTQLKPTQPFTFSFSPSELTVSDVTLTGPSTQVTLAGTIGLREPAPLNMRVNGQVDLKLIESKFPGVLSTGVINLQVDVRGSVQSPDLRGSAVLSNASLRRPGLFTSLTNINGTLTFNQNQIRLDNLQGTAGGGTVRAEGTAVLQGAAVQGMNIEINVDNVRLRGYPEGLRTVITGRRLTLRGALASPLLEGNIQIENLAYRSSFEDFLALMKEENLRKASSPLGNLRLSMHIEGGKNITIQNQLADVEARVDVDLKGTVDEPSLTGHVEASGGSLLFQGNKYTVTRGNIDFVDPIRILPVLDVEAESQVRDYRVILSISGRGDNPKLTLRSDPPLPELEIVSLIAGGQTREEIASRPASSPGAVPSSERLFQSGAASILFDLLQQRVGNRLGLLGSGRVRVDPFLVGAENNPGARITLSEQLTKELTVTYSQDLSSNRQQVILIEYFISRNTSIVASKDELGNYGLDLRHRIRIK